MAHEQIADLWKMDTILSVASAVMPKRPSSKKANAIHWCFENDAPV